MAKKKEFKEIETIAFARLRQIIKDNPGDKVVTYITEDGFLFDDEHKASTWSGKSKMGLIRFDENAKGFKQAKQSPQKKTFK